jgi:predicted RNA-binding Zn ribbon-like protein
MTDSPLADAPTYKFVGGRLCLDFCNTGENREMGYVGELLGGYSQLLAWTFQTGLLTASEVRTLSAEADRRPEVAQAVYRQATRLREALYRLFSAIAHGQTAADEDLAELNAALAQGLGHLAVQQAEQGLGWVWRSDPADLAQMLWPVAYSAAELLTQPDLQRVRECENGHCSWLFLDLSRNHSRRWCTMEDCGNVVKARRHRQKRQTT